MSNKLIISPELKLIIAILTEHVDLTISMDLNWKYFVELLIRHRVIEQVYTRLKNEKSVPESVKQQLDVICQKQRLHLLMLSGEVVRLSRRLTEVGVNYAVVKGVPLSVNAYGGITKRHCKDIDLWVDWADWDKAIAVMSSCGYQQTRPSYSLTGFKRDYYLKRNHDFEFFNPQKNVQVELMFRVSYLGVDFPNLLQIPLKLCEINDNQIMTLDDTYHVLLLIVHGAIHTWHRLRWLLDIYLLIQQQKIDLDKLLVLAEQFECQHMVVQCLWLIREIFGLETQEMQLQVNKITSKDLKIARLLFEFIVADYELTGGHGIFNRMFYKYRGYLMQITPPKQRWRVIKNDLFKIDKIFSSINLPRGFGFCYYLLYPLFVLKYVIRRNF
ncbi:MAG: hypothetical protein EKK64_07760 [Neisseriaceae bacterium]|nr:MAG: hypothetical protein EKK64_07760 [Neisseriaceae bacterium]